jgi:hypothetical protein
LAEPSSAIRSWIGLPSGSLKGFTRHWDVLPLSSLNWTEMLRRMASLRAVCKPFITASEAVRIWVFWIQVWKAGRPRAKSTPMIATTTRISISEMPDCRAFSTIPSS